eukprot:TRINITY_DN3807_c0_g1_i3.p1 TRINITY_DN3807_c0_g1~~TRINITY_DN3807_c0_g1_i3.p1  ORF type:complete len:381 (+),score=55.66 TRINITY_DN3807_c0_g1_i3:702-1844(+)
MISCQFRLGLVLKTRAMSMRDSAVDTSNDDNRCFTNPSTNRRSVKTRNSSSNEGTLSTTRSQAKEFLIVNDESEVFEMKIEDDEGEADFLENTEDDDELRRSQVLKGSDPQRLSRFSPKVSLSEEDDEAKFRETDREELSDEEDEGQEDRNATQAYDGEDDEYEDRLLSSAAFLDVGLHLPPETHSTKKEHYPTQPHKGSYSPQTKKALQLHATKTTHKIEGVYMPVALGSTEQMTVPIGSQERISVNMGSRCKHDDLAKILQRVASLKKISWEDSINSGSNNNSNKSCSTGETIADEISAIELFNTKISSTTNPKSSHVNRTLMSFAQRNTDFMNNERGEGANQLEQQHIMSMFSFGQLKAETTWTALRHQRRAEKTAM